MKLNVNTAALVALFAASTATQHASGKNMDVLMIAVDDLRPQIDCVDLPGAVRPKMHTPNICKLAKDSLVLERSQVAMATCKFRVKRGVTLIARGMKLTRLCSHAPVAALLPARVGQAPRAVLHSLRAGIRARRMFGISSPTFATSALQETGAQFLDTLRTCTGTGRGAWERSVSSLSSPQFLAYPNVQIILLFRSFTLVLPRGKSPRTVQSALGQMTELTRGRSRTSTAR